MTIRAEQIRRRLRQLELTRRTLDKQLAEGTLERPRPPTFVSDHQARLAGAVGGWIRAGLDDMSPDERERFRVVAESRGREDRRRESIRASRDRVVYHRESIAAIDVERSVLEEELAAIDPARGVGPAPTVTRDEVLAKITELTDPATGKRPGYKALAKALHTSVATVRRRLGKA